MNLQLSITERCNLRCTYCYYKETHAKRSSDMSDLVMEDSVRLAINRCIEKKIPIWVLLFLAANRWCGWILSKKR